MQSYGRIARLAFAVAPVAAILILSGCGHSSSPPPRRDTGAAPLPPTREDTVEAGLRPPARESFRVRLQYLQSTQEEVLIAEQELVVSAHDIGLRRLPAGTWKVSARTLGPAKKSWPVFVKAFEHYETAALRDALDHWRKQGFAPSVTTMGHAVAGSGGALHDNRLYWLAVRRCASEAEAEALKRQLQGQKVWAWSREEVDEPARANVTFRSAVGGEVLHAASPVTVRSEGQLTLPDARKGHPPVTVPAPMEILADHTGHTAFLGEVALEEYLRGILPAEMYASWPLEALKAQAVAARSEVLVHARGKHFFDGYDFCIEQHCRAFGGRGLYDPRTDQAVKETEGVILVAADKSIVPTVFSSNCGGWTESNENVWDGAAQPALRGRPDSRDAERRGSHNHAERWLNSSGHAYCAGDKDYYRWTRSISLAKLSAQFNRDYGIGNLRAIEALERGVSGRLKSVRVVGDRKSAVINKELNIRRAFENLPSALCAFSIQGGTVHIRGAGRGHGVGLCQHGANGMARENLGYEAILRHYFSGVSLARL